MINLNHLNNVLGKLAIYFNKPEIPDLVFKAYFSQLSMLTDDELDQAIELYLFSGTTFPTPEDILEKAGKSPRKDAQIQYHNLCNGKAINKLTHQIAKTFNIKGELRTIEYLSGKEYAYKEGEIKKKFIEEYAKKFIELLMSDSLESELMIVETEVKPTQKSPEPTDLISAEQWQILKSKLNSALH